MESVTDPGCGPGVKVVVTGKNHLSPVPGRLREAGKREGQDRFLGNAFAIIKLGEGRGGEAFYSEVKRNPSVHMAGGKTGALSGVGRSVRACVSNTAPAPAPPLRSCCCCWFTAAPAAVASTQCSLPAPEL